MVKLCILVGTTVGGIVFGWTASALGCEFFASFLWSGLGAMLGCWAGWKLHQEYFN